MSDTLLETLVFLKCSSAALGYMSPWLNSSQLLILQGTSEPHKLWHEGS